MTESRHNLARLRAILEMTQPELAKLLGCSVPTIKAIEGNKGRLDLSRALAERAEYQTGVSIDWLLKNDASEQPTFANSTTQYLKSHFEQRQAAIKQSKSDSNIQGHQAGWVLCKAVKTIAALLLRAGEKGQTDLCAYKLQKALDELSAIFNVRATDLQAMQPKPKTGWSEGPSDYSVADTPLAEASEVLKIFRSRVKATENPQAGFIAVFDADGTIQQSATIEPKGSK